MFKWYQQSLYIYIKTFGTFSTRAQTEFTSFSNNTQHHQLSCRYCATNMANITRRLFRPLKNSYSNIVNSNYSFKTNHNVIKFIKTSAGLIAIGGIVLYAGKKYHSVNVVYAAARPRKVTFLYPVLPENVLSFYIFFIIYLITILNLLLSYIYLRYVD